METIWSSRHGTGARRWRWIWKKFTPRRTCARSRPKAEHNEKPFAGPPDLLSLSQILRLAGNYVDRMGGRLLRVSWQDQSEKIQSITVQWEPSQPGRKPGEGPLTTIEELCIHVYKQRKKINLLSERQGNRPFVSVARGG